MQTIDPTLATALVATCVGAALMIRFSVAKRQLAWCTATTKREGRRLR